MTDAANPVPATDDGTEAAIAAWEGPPRGARPDAAPVLAVDGFAGPLDWLLEMVRAQKIDLARLSIAALIEAFAAAMTAALADRSGAGHGRADPSGAGRSGAGHSGAGHHAARIEHWAAWTVMAASLTELWSRLLLPRDAPAARAAADEAEALRRRLLERARMRAAADWLERQPQLGQAGFARGTPEVPPSGRASDLTDLLRACLAALQVPASQAEAVRPRPPRLWQASDAILRLRRLLPVLPDGSPLGDFCPRVAERVPNRPLHRRAAVASTLVAGLELNRAGTLRLDQDVAWADISVRRGMRDEATVAVGVTTTVAD